MNLIGNQYGAYLHHANNNLINPGTTSICTGGIKLIVSNYNTVCNSICRDTNGGIEISGSHNNIIRDNTISNYAYLRLGSSNNNIVKWNSVSYAGGGGIELSGSQGNTIFENNLESTAGMYIQDNSNNNIISDNSINRNSYCGILLHNCENNNVYGNTISINGNNGIFISRADGNTIYENTILSAGGYNINIQDSSSNIIYHNNIIDTTLQVYDSNPVNNDWHHPDLLEGNYWSDYQGEDKGEEPYPWDPTGKHLVAGDGIGDTLVPHPSINYDYYPFIEPDYWLNAPPVANAGGPYLGYEGSEITFDASLSTDPDTDPLQFRWDFNDDGAWDTDWSESPTAPYTWLDDHIGTAIVEVSDGSLTETAEADVTVLNADPIIEDIVSPIDPVPIYTPTQISAPFTDPGTLDTHYAQINWGDGEITDGVVDEAFGSGTVTGSHPYTTPGVYQITLTVWDYDGGEDSITTEYVVQYDPLGAFVTGGGMIDSPAGAFPADPGLTGKAGFGFVSKYQKGATIPDGNTQFRFHAADLKFHSTSYRWMVVAGPKAMFKGSGEINGEGDYGFLLSAIDGEQPGGGGEDKFRIKIWDKVTEDIIYDNEMGEDEYGDPTTLLTHGSIKIHKA
jgi:parallel beta-helix repeat protein